MIELHGSTLLIERWTGARPSSDGVDVRSVYVDHYWVPILGPAATCAIRALARAVSAAAPGDDVELELSYVAQAIGLPADGPQEQLLEVLGRLERVGALTAGIDGAVRVSGRLPFLTDAEVEQLPEPLRSAHLAAFGRQQLDGDEHGLRPAREATAPNPPSARLLGLSATVDELLTNHDLTERQTAYRWQHVLRLAEEARDDAVVAWAAADLETTIGEFQLTAQAMTEAIWITQHSLGKAGVLPDVVRSMLTDAAAGLIDFLVDEFPSEDPTPMLLDTTDL